MIKTQNPYFYFKKETDIISRMKSEKEDSRKKLWIENDLDDGEKLMIDTSKKKPTDNKKNYQLRIHILNILSKIPTIHHNDEHFKHGRLSVNKLGITPLLENIANIQSPIKTWVSNLPPRSDHSKPDWINASEFTDDDNTINIKLDILALLLKLSKKTVIYSGAGISVASGIKQAALGKKSNKEKGKNVNAIPNLTHYSLETLRKWGLLNKWIQQNHDGLPQKAGFPQELINEIHGSWYDPSNPVVKYSGYLKSDSLKSLDQDIETADLVLVIGTSLSGLYADSLVSAVESRSRQGTSLGSVIINLQQTSHDGDSTLRIFGPSDIILSRLLQRHVDFLQNNSGSSIKNNSGSSIKNNSIYDYKEQRNSLIHKWNSLDNLIYIPYDKYGKRIVNYLESKWMLLDLRKGSRICLTNNHNAIGSHQPAYIKLGEDSELAEGIVIERDNSICSIEIQMKQATAPMRLGLWWLDVAMRGAVEQLPIINVHPIMVEFDTIFR